MCYCMIETSSVLSRKTLVIFGNPRKFSVIFGNPRKFSEKDCMAFGKLLENLRKSSENRQKDRHQIE